MNTTGYAPQLFAKLGFAISKLKCFVFVLVHARNIAQLLAFSGILLDEQISSNRHCACRVQNQKSSIAGTTRRVDSICLFHRDIAWAISGFVEQRGDLVGMNESA